MKSKQTKVWVLSFSRFARRPIFSRFQMSGKLSEKVRPQNELAESSEVLAAYHVSTRYSKSTLKVKCATRSKLIKKGFHNSSWLLKFRGIFHSVIWHDPCLHSLLNELEWWNLNYRDKESIKVPKHESLPPLEITSPTSSRNKGNFEESSFQGAYGCTFHTNRMWGYFLIRQRHEWCDRHRSEGLITRWARNESLVAHRFPISCPTSSRVFNEINLVFFFALHFQVTRTTPTTGWYATTPSPRPEFLARRSSGDSPEVRPVSIIRPFFNIFK